VAEVIVIESSIRPTLRPELAVVSEGGESPLTYQFRVIKSKMGPPWRQMGLMRGPIGGKRSKFIYVG
jgi:hypothetical protein